MKNIRKSREKNHSSITSVQNYISNFEGSTCRLLIYAKLIFRKPISSDIYGKRLVVSLIA